MAKTVSVLLILLLTACASVPRPLQYTASPCAAHEASYECQVERYHNINVD
jgi:starvation-inducible outer membrane lipoprotein